MKISRAGFWFFLFPCLLTYTLTVFIPSVSGIYYSLTTWSGFVTEPVFVGFSNYLKALKDDNFIYSFFYTFVFAMLAVIIVNVSAFLLALLVTQNFKGRNILRSIFFLPNLIGGILVGFIWQFIFTQVFSQIGSRTGISFLEGWLATRLTGTIGLLTVVVWQMSGYMMLIYIAQIQSIPDELIEAAYIDGASSLYTLFRIKLPLMMPAFTVCLFLTLSNCFKLYTQNLTLTGGGPAGKTEMLSLHITTVAFGQNRMGLAQAEAVLFLLVVAGITLLQFKITKSREVDM
jgi:raffinose/stachyose/melibiose transport system permease protein